MMVIIFVMVALSSSFSLPNTCLFDQNFGPHRVQAEVNYIYRNTKD